MHLDKDQKYYFFRLCTELRQHLLGNVDQKEFLMAQSLKFIDMILKHDQVNNTSSKLVTVEKCPKCNVEMVEGIAIKCNSHRGLVFLPDIINHESLKLINVLKCPSCGHSEDMSEQVNLHEL